MLLAELFLAGHIFLALYIVGGPLTWLGLLVLFFISRSKMARLRTNTYALPEKPPRVSVLVPAKDEAASVRTSLERVLQLDYPIFDVTAINDRSTDDTGKIITEMARHSPEKFRALRIDHLPPGWLGKCNALHVATRDASGEWLLFVDADVNVEPAALRDALALAIARKYDALSILTRLECHSFIERLMLPLCGACWATMFQASRTNDDNRDVALANGQFFLIRRQAYEAVGGHEAVKDRIVEDVELMRLLKSRGFRTRLMLGSHLASTRMHTTLRAIFRGWGRIYSGTARRKVAPILAAILFLLGSGLSVYPALCFGIVRAISNHRFGWLDASIIHLLLMTTFLALIYRGSGNRPRYAALFPIGSALLIGILAYSIRLCLGGTVEWRGSNVKAH